jgi:membrane associated rhomboid family serine protease
MLLIAANVGCFIAQKMVDAAAPRLVESMFALSAEGVKQGFVWQFATYSFLHGGELYFPWHLLANMLMLFFVGREMEAILGPRHFLAVYFGGGLVGGLAQWLAYSHAAIDPFHPHVVMGASACVMAVFIAFTTTLPELELTLLLFFVIPVHIRARHLAQATVGLSVLFLVTHTLPDICHWAHIGGCLFGWLYVKQLGYGNPLRIQKYLFEKRQQAERVERMSPQQFITEEIDPILEKISRDGIRSLTRNERRILEKGREKIARKRH